MGRYFLLGQDWGMDLVPLYIYIYVLNCIPTEIKKIHLDPPSTRNNGVLTINSLFEYVGTFA